MQQLIREGHYISKSSSMSSDSDSKEVIRIKQARNPLNGKMEWADVSNPDVRGNFKFYRDDQIINDFIYLEGQQASDTIAYHDVSQVEYPKFDNIGDLSSISRPEIIPENVSEDISENTKTQPDTKETVREVVKEVVREVKEPLEKSVLQKCRTDKKHIISITLDIELGYNIPKLSNLIQTLELDTNKIINMMSNEIDVSMSLAKSKIMEELIRGKSDLSHPDPSIDDNKVETVENLNTIDNTTDNSTAESNIIHPSPDSEKPLNLNKETNANDDFIRDELASINAYLKTI